MSFTVAVAGASGYAGGELLRLLQAHPEAELGAITARSNAGQPLASVHPHLTGLADRVLGATEAEALAGHDVIVLALPHGASGEVTARLEELSPRSVMVDLGADHRLEDPAEWERYYGGVAAPAWAYGMPELVRGPSKQRELLAGARRIAVPGCNVTAVTLGLAPGVAAGVASAADVVAVLACGVSGAGREPKAHLQAAEIMGAASAYQVGGSHRHIPEILQNLARAGAAEPSISFTPALVPMTRGILATVTALPGPLFDPATWRDAWLGAYADEPFVRVTDRGLWPSTAMTLGANTARVGLAFDQRAGRIVTVTAIDNLVKGAAGAAVQSINLALGLEETLGLPVAGVAP